MAIGLQFVITIPNKKHSPRQRQVGSSHRWKVPANLPLFLKSEKIPTMFYGRKEPKFRPFRDFQPIPSAYQPWA
jgi:hypothetical protein